MTTAERNVVAEVNGITVTAVSHDIIPALGLLPEMATNGRPEVADPVANIEANYPWFFGWDTESKATIDSNGRYHYPQDTPLDWLCKYEGKDPSIVMYQYPYGIIAVAVNGKLTKTTRCD